MFNFSLLCFAFLIQAIPCFCSDSELISLILANEEICVQAYDENKIYLKPENILATTKGLFLNLRDFYTPIETIHSDSNGCYLQSTDARHMLNKCPGCGRRYLVYCTTPNCRYNPKGK